MAGIGALRQLIRGLEAEKRALRDENMALKSEVATLKAVMAQRPSETLDAVSDESPIQETEGIHDLRGIVKSVRPAGKVRGQ